MHARNLECLRTRGQASFKWLIQLFAITDCVYDGDYGWVFIEEDGYKLVIESILEKQEKKRVEEKGEASNELHNMQISEPVLKTGGMRSQQSQCEVSADPLHSREMEAQSTMTSHGNVIGLQQHSEPPKQRRPPCYGWISESEDDEDS